MQSNYKCFITLLALCFPAALALPAASASAPPNLPSPKVGAAKGVYSDDPPSGYHYARDGGNTGLIGSTAFTLNCDTLICPNKGDGSCPYVDNNSISFLTSTPGTVHDPPQGGHGLCAKNTKTGAQEHVWFGQTLGLSNTQGLSYLINVTVGSGENWRNTAPVIIDISNKDDPTCTRISDSWWDGTKNQSVYGGAGAIIGQPGTVDAGYWYIYGNEMVNGKEQNAVDVAGVKPADAQTLSAYKYWDGSDWVSDQTKAVSILDGGIQGSISYNAHLGGYLYLFSYINYIQARFAYHPQGPWSGVTSLFDGPGILYAPVAEQNFDPSGKTTQILFSNHATATQQRIRKVTWQ